MTSFMAYKRGYEDLDSYNEAALLDDIRLTFGIRKKPNGELVPPVRK